MDGRWLCLFAVYHLVPQSMQAALAAGCQRRNSTVITHQSYYTSVILLALYFKHFRGVQKSHTCLANSVNPGWVGPLLSETGNSVLLMSAWSRERALSPPRIINTACLFIYLFCVSAPFYKSRSALRL